MLACCAPRTVHGSATPQRVPMCESHVCGIYVCVTYGSQSSASPAATPHKEVYKLKAGEGVHLFVWVWMCCTLARLAFNVITNLSDVKYPVACSLPNIAVNCGREVTLVLASGVLCVLCMCAHCAGHAVQAVAVAMKTCVRRAALGVTAYYAASIGTAGRVSPLDLSSKFPLFFLVCARLDGQAIQSCTQLTNLMSMGAHPWS